MPMRLISFLSLSCVVRGHRLQDESGERAIPRSLNAIAMLMATEGSSSAFNLPRLSPRARLDPAERSAQPVMMPKFIKDLFPNLEKPEDALGSIQDAFGGIFKQEEPEPIVEINVTAPSSALTSIGAEFMPLLGGFFSLEADLQAALLNLGSYDEEEVKAEIQETIESAPVVIYTYGLSPFSSEAVNVLESTGCNFRNVELGGEWFLLGPKASATRVELRKLYGQGSLPHIFIGGEWVGGLASGANGGINGLIESDELADKLRAAKAV